MVLANSPIGPEPVRNIDTNEEDRLYEYVKGAYLNSFVYVPVPWVVHQ